MSDTPRTDAYHRSLPAWKDTELLDFARKLERELAAAKVRLDFFELGTLAHWEKDLTAANARAELWRTRCKEAQTSLSAYMRYLPTIDMDQEDIIIRDAGKDE